MTVELSKVKEGLCVKVSVVHDLDLINLCICWGVIIEPNSTQLTMQSELLLGNVNKSHTVEQLLELVR